MTTEPTYYELLGVQHNATPAEIKAAYRQHAFRNHPDRGGNPALFRLLENAYSTLSSPSKREEYDVWLTASGDGTPPGGVRFTAQQRQAYATSGWHEDDVPNFADREPVAEEDSEDDYQTSDGGDGDRPLFSNGSKTFRGDKATAAGGASAHSFKKLRAHKAIKPAFVVWVLIAAAFGLPFLPGVSVAVGIAVIGYFFLFRIFGSFLLRLAGWTIAIWAIIEAHKHQSPIPLTCLKLACAFALWMAGQWFFARRHGRWHSVIAHMVVNRFPAWMQPNRSRSASAA